MGYLNIRAPFNKRKVESAEELWRVFMEYIQHSESTPVIENKLFNARDGLRHGTLEKERPFTLHGLCNFIGIHPGTWDNWKKREKESETIDPDHCPYFAEVMLQIESIIYDHQFQGASVDIFNATIISRKLGLADKTDYVSSDGSMTPTTITRTIVDPKEDA